MLILSNKSSIPQDTPAIYLMYDNQDKLLYIGKTKNLENRLKTHIHIANNSFEDWRVSLSYIEYFRVDLAIDRELYETYLINKLKPQYNLDKVYSDDTSIVLPELTNGKILKIKVISQNTISPLLEKNFKSVINQIREFYPNSEKELTLEQVDILDSAFYKYPYLKIIIDQLGYEYIEGHGYRTDSLKRVSKLYLKDDLDEKVKEKIVEFINKKETEVISNKELKRVFKKIYKSLEIDKSSKASDIIKYFNCLVTSVWDKELKKSVRAYKILDSK